MRFPSTYSLCSAYEFVHKAMSFAAYDRLVVMSSYSSSLLSLSQMDQIVGYADDDGDMADVAAVSSYFSFDIDTADEYAASLHSEQHAPASFLASPQANADREASSGDGGRSAGKQSPQETAALSSEGLPNRDRGLTSGGARSKSTKIAFKTRSEVEVLDDGYRWRKYGKKMVKNSPNPRNYYRCSSEGCRVKKRVERERDDARFVITTYDGVHNHPMPLPPRGCAGYPLAQPQGMAAAVPLLGQRQRSTAVPPAV